MYENTDFSLVGKGKGKETEVREKISLSLGKKNIVQREKGSGKRRWRERETKEKIEGGMELQKQL